MNFSDSDEVLFEELAGPDGCIGLITLNRPKVLNSLNHTMIHALHTKLQTWATAQHIKAVVISAAGGRAFCAGGDLRLTYERYKAHDPLATSFFRDEYQLNRLIFHFPKPYIALLDGITMGGGVGISIHGSHRVATDYLLFAMPETGIGFFPDVGGSYFLPRLPGQMGFYLGLTGARLTSDDCAALGIVQHKTERERLPELIRALAEEPFQRDAYATVTHILNQFDIAVKPSLLIQQQAEIDACFSKDTMESIVQALPHFSHSIGKEANVAITQKSPTSLKVTLRALREGMHLSFDACMQQEYRLACHFLQGHDFPEGIRAVIIDKDQTPHWQPASLNEVTESEIAGYFTS